MRISKKIVDAHANCFKHLYNCFQQLTCLSAT